MSTHIRNRLLNWRSVRVLVAGAATSIIAACSGFLDVPNPNNVPEDALAQPASATAQANGVLGATTRMLGAMATPYGEATDELDWIGSRDAWLELDRGIVGNYLNEFSDGAFPYVGEARYLADRTIKQLMVFDAAATLSDRTDLARTYLYGAIIYASIADMYDDFDYSDKQKAAKPIGRAQMGSMYDTAKVYLDRAYTIATASNTAAFVALRFPILAYRARVQHAKAAWASVTPKGNWTATVGGSAALVQSAAVDADANAAIALATADQKYVLTNNVEATAGINIWFEVNGRNESSLGAVFCVPAANLTCSATTAFKDTVTGAADPTATASLAAFKAFGSQKGDLTITSVREMRLILAESQLAGGNSANFRTQLNTVRALDGKPAFAGVDNLGNAVPDRVMLARERQVQLFLMRRRLIDMYRFNQKSAKWVASADASVEDATRFNGLLFPIPNVERLANPCIANPSATGC